MVDRHRHPPTVAARGLFAAVAISLAACAPPSGGSPSDTMPALNYLVTAEQVGPVAYRDPLGAVSPDGTWLVRTVQDRLHVSPIGGGGTSVLGSGESSIRSLHWLPDSRHIATRERVFDRSRQEWWVYDRVDGTREPLWPGRSSAPDLLTLDMLAWSSTGRVVGVTREGSTSTVWSISEDGSEATEVATGARLRFPFWGDGGQIGCLRMEVEHQYLHLPCDSAEPLFDDQEVYGPVVWHAADNRLVYSSPGVGGFLDLFSRPATADGSPRRLTSFARDAYAPSIGAFDLVVFKSQDYRTFLATAPADGGATTPLTAFQSETPTWSPDGTRVAFTFGSWRHVTDDFHYPDIAQHIGVVSVGSEATTAAPHTEPERVVRRSYSEDQSMTWSPNGEWIVFHTHEESDDVWLMRADGSDEPRMISVEGNETGWPRWSRDGQWIVFPSYRRNDSGARQAYLFLIGVDQNTGEVTQPQTRIDLEGFEHDIVQGEWLDDGETLVFEAAEAIGRKSLWRVGRTGGRPVSFHQFGSDQVHSGIGVSPDGRWAAYVDRAADGHFQIFRVGTSGGGVQQLTFDPTHKTQPMFSPDGQRIAFTVFSYNAHFWAITP